MSDVFISYSRENDDFVEQLKRRLEAHEFDVWVDTEDLYVGEEFWPEVAKAIDAATVFVFIISPASATSKFCTQEVAHAANAGKRIVPVCHVKPTDEPLADDVAKRHWVSFTAADDPDAAMVSLLSAIKADWVELRLQSKVHWAACEWRDNDRDTSLLWRGRVLAVARQWRTRNIGLDTGATAEHSTFIDSSLVGQKRRRQKIAGSSLAAVAAILVISWFGLTSWVSAVNNMGEIDVRSGVTDESLGQLERAQRVCDRLIPNPVACLHVRLVLGHSYETVNRYDAAISQYTGAIENVSTYKMTDEETADFLGNAHQSRAFSRIMLADTDTDRIRQRSTYLLAEKDIGVAMRYYRTTAKGLSGRPFILTQARVAVGLGEYEKARDQLEIVRTLQGGEDPGPDVDLLYAVVHRCLGDAGQSQKHLGLFIAAMSSLNKPLRQARGVAYYNGVECRCQV